MAVSPQAVPPEAEQYLLSHCHSIKLENNMNDRLYLPISILIADDDQDDRLLIREAFEEAHLNNRLDFVENGIELLSYLRRQGKYDDTKQYFSPSLVLLDLNMPLKDGREALMEIKRDLSLRHIPVIVLTTSKFEEDIIQSYNLGAAGFITKPVSFAGLVEAVSGLGEYWFEIVKLPQKNV
jgi:CheY-like chemotaxis protein